MEQPALKYRLRELTDSLPRSLSAGDISRVLTAEYGITRGKFYNHMALVKGSTQAITDTDLAKYAAFFGVSEQEIRNYTPVDKKKSRTVYEIFRTTPRPSLNSIAALAGMSATS